MIDAYVTRPSYVAHVAAVWRALPPEERGMVYAGVGMNELRPYAPDLTWAVGRPLSGGGGPVIVASGADSQAVEGRPVVLLEHGAGQSYAGVDASGYSGGVGRDRVSLFLTPNETVAERNRARYPNAEHVVCGAPAVNVARPARCGPDCRRTVPIVAVTFHWRCPVVPETRPALEHYEGALANIALDRNRRYRLLGHGHPRQWHEYRQLWERLGVLADPLPRNVLAAADVLVADNTSLLYEAARLDVPVVVLDAPWYRREVEHGLRFWSHADIGVRISDPIDLTTAIDCALADPPHVARLRRELAADVFPLVGDDAAAVAVAAILALGK